jgi:predicted dehydrogenase
MTEPAVHRVLVIGVGSIGERHVRCFLQTKRADVSIVEVNETARHEVAGRYAVLSHADLDRAIEWRPNAAVICTPAHLHVPIALRLAEAGVHLLVEKPLSTSLDGIDRLQSEVVRRSILCGVAYVFRWHPVLAEMRDAVASGRFGRPLQLTAVCGQHFPKYRPAYRTIYYRDRATGGGAIQDALTHVINAGEWLVGPVTRVVADAAHQALVGVEVEDTVHVLARHAPVAGAEVLACYSLNQHQAPNETMLNVVCQGGTARFEAHAHRWRWMAKPAGEWHYEVHPSVERDDLFVGQAHGFLDAVEGKRPMSCPLDQGLATLRVNLAALSSLERGGWQELPAGTGIGTRTSP